MTTKQALTEATIKFKKNKVKFPQLEAEILLSHIIKKPREYLFTYPEAKLTKKQVSGFRFQVSKRLRGVPIAYIIGQKEFYGLKFLVDKNVLVPRPETELMVDTALAVMKKDTATIIDVGTGSGCIIVSIAKEIITNYELPITNKTPRDNFQLIGIDISKKALAVAKKNATLNGVYKTIKFINGDLLAPLIPKIESASWRIKLKIICANLPYLTPAQIKNSPTLKFDPKLALSAGADGLKYYRRLFKQLRQTDVQNFVLLCEIDPSQKISIRRLAKKLLPQHTLEIKKDLRGHNRLAMITSKQ